MIAPSGEVESRPSGEPVKDTVTHPFGGMSRLSITVVVSVLLAGAAIAAPAGDARYLIDFSESDNLKVLFDAGLRPSRVLGLESQECEIGTARLAIRLPGSPEFDIDIERASFDILRGNAIASARFFGVDEPVPLAVERVKRICAAMGLSTEGLDALVGNLGTAIDPKKRWHRSRRRNGVQASVTFYPMFYRRGVEVQTWVGIQWLRRTGEYHLLEEPIQPPPGYEHVLMDPQTPWRDRERRATLHAVVPAATPDRLHDGKRTRTVEATRTP